MLAARPCCDSPRAHATSTSGIGPRTGRTTRTSGWWTSCVGRRLAGRLRRRGPGCRAVAGTTRRSSAAGSDLRGRSPDGEAPREGTHHDVEVAGLHDRHVLEPDKREALNRQAERHRAPLAGGEGDLLEVAQALRGGVERRVKVAGAQL